MAAVAAAPLIMMAVSAAAATASTVLAATAASKKPTIQPLPDETALAKKDAVLQQAGAFKARKGTGLSGTLFSQMLPPSLATATGGTTKATFGE